MSNILYPVDFSQYIVGKEYQPLHARTAKTNTSAVLSMINQARQTVDLFTHNLDPSILDNTEISKAIMDFIKISKNSRLRILICNPNVANQHGHRLIELSRKFSSFISIRETNAEYKSKPCSFLIIDGRAMIYRPHANEYNAMIDFRSGQESRKNTELFNEIWERSEPISKIRQLFI
ncbi:MAG: hypothetical protein GY781_13960 [Gammaproteobacteria bacterium]|nr:hypothetical protein [Gammaproteobacteria bacterium]